MFHQGWLTISMVALTALYATVLPAHAGVMTMEIESNGSMVTVADGGALDLDPTNNQVTFSGPVGDMEIVVTVGVSNEPGSLDPGATLSMTSLSINNIGPEVADLSIRISETDYTTPSGFGTELLISDLSASYIGNDPANSVTYQSFVDDSNALFGTTQSTAILSAPVTNAGLETTAPVTISDPYSITAEMFISLGVNNTLTATGNTTVIIPEPTSLALLLPALGTLMLRHKRRA